MSFVESEKTALAQKVGVQPDGPGLRIDRRAELIIFGEVLPGGAELFRQRIGQFQAEAPYWETRIGTVHDFRIHLFDNDTRILFAITYDGDFKPYIADIVTLVAGWFDPIFPGIWKGFVSAADASTAQLLQEGAVTSDFFYVAHPDVTVRDLARLKRLGKAVNELLDALN